MSTPWALFIALKSSIPVLPTHRINRWCPPINLFQNLSNVGQRLPEVVPQVVLQQGQAHVPLCSAQHMDGRGVAQTNGPLQYIVQSLYDVKLFL